MDSLNFNVTSNIKEASEAVGKLSGKFTTLGRNTKQITSKFGQFQTNIKKVDKSLINLTKDSNRSNGSLLKLNSTFGKINTALSVAQMYALARAISSSIQASLDAIEVNNLFAVSLGSMADSAEAVLTNINEITGLDTTQLKSSTGTFALLARSMGINAENASTLSTEMSKLSLDLSSLTNVPINQVMQDLRSGLVGQSETVYKYGLDVTEANLKQEAMRQGIEKSVRNMSQGEKMALRYSIMIRKTALAHGDFAKTIETPTNQLRILASQVVTLSRAFGTIFIPMLSATLPYINAMVKLMIQLTRELAKLVGYVPQEATGAISDLGDSAGEASESIDGVGSSIKKLKNLVGGFDELNLLSEQSKSGTSGVELGDPNQFDFETYDNMLDMVETKSSRIFQRLFESLNNLYQRTSDIMKPATDSFNSFREVLTETLLDMGILEEVFDDTGYLVGYSTNLDLLENILSSIQPIAETFANVVASAFHLMEEVLKSLQPTLTTFSNDVFPKFKESFSEAFKERLETINYQLDRFNIWLDENPQKVERFAKAMLVLTGVLTGFTVLRGIVKLLLVLLSPLITLLGFLVTPMGLVTVALTGLTIAFVKAYTENDEFRDKVNEAWDNIKTKIQNAVQSLQPVFEFFANMFDNVAKTATIMYGLYLKPIIDNIAREFGNLWTNHLKPFLDRFISFANTIINEVILPIVNNLLVVLQPVVVTVFNAIISSVSTVLSFILDVVSALMRTLEGLIQFITGIFTGDWERAWEGVTNIFGGLFEGMIAIVEGVFNSIIDIVNFALGGIYRGINAVIRGINAIEIEIPEWVPRFGGDSFSPNLGSLTIPVVPKLYRGGSVADGQLFSAGEFGKAELIGSYNNQTTVMPLEDSGFVEAMYQAVFDAVTNAQGDGKTDVTVKLDSKVLAKATASQTRQRSTIYGKDVSFAR